MECDPKQTYPAECHAAGGNPGGSQVNALLAGTFVVEAIFNWPGLGWYATRVILASDYMAVVSITLVVAVLCTSGELIVDLLYGVLDPRIQQA